MGIGGVESSLRSSTWALGVVTRNPISLGPKWLTDSLVVAVSAKEVFGVVGLEGGVLGRQVLVAHGADEAGRVEDDPQGPQDLPRAERLLPALMAARVAALLLLKQIDAVHQIGCAGMVKGAGSRLRDNEGGGDFTQPRAHLIDYK